METRHTLRKCFAVRLFGKVSLVYSLKTEDETENIFEGTASDETKPLSTKSPAFRGALFLVRCAGIVAVFCLLRYAISILDNHLHLGFPADDSRLLLEIFCLFILSQVGIKLNKG